jgi:hypothetical protein
MRAPRFALDPVDETFFDSAPVQLVETFHASRSAAEVWSELTSDHPLGWCKLLKDVSWTSPRPLGVGSTRIVRTQANASIFNERFFVWEEGRRKSFYVMEASGPLFKRFAEDYVVEPTSDTTCDFTWKIAIEPKPLARVTTPVNKLLLSTLFKDTLKHFA